MVRKTHANRAGGVASEGKKKTIPRLMTTREAAELLGMSPDTFTEMGKQFFSVVRYVENGNFHWPADEVELFATLLLSGSDREAARRAIKQHRITEGRLTPTQSRSE